MAFDAPGKAAAEAPLQEDGEEDGVVRSAEGHPAAQAAGATALQCLQCCSAWPKSRRQRSRKSPGAGLMQLRASTVQQTAV